MPSVTELIELRNQARAADERARAAAARLQAAEAALAEAKRTLAALRKQAARAESRLKAIRRAMSQISSVQAEVQSESQALAAMANQLEALDKKIAALAARIRRYRQRPARVVPPALLASLKQMRAEREALLQQQQQVQATLSQAQAQLAQLQAEADQFDAARKAAAEAKARAKLQESKLAGLEAAAQEAAQEAANAQAAAQALTGQLQQALDRLISGLDPQVPVVLLPVRLETRFRRPAAGQPPDELLVRIYPDDIHQDTHEPGLTEVELKMGAHFWRETWRAGLAAQATTDYAARHAQELAAWQQLAGRFGPARAAYIARRMEPVNAASRPADLNTDPSVPLAAEPQFDQAIPQRASSWTRAARARSLPDRWLVIGYRAGQVSNTQWGELIPAVLPTGPDPSAATTTQSSAVPVDPGMRWMVDFAEAESLGMGIRLSLSVAEASSGFDRLFVLGIKGSLNDPREGAAELRALVEAHRFTWGAGLIPQGTPTNNTETVASGHSREDVGFQTSFMLEREPPRITSGDGSDGALAALGLGLEAADLAPLRASDGHDQRDAALINRVLWPATLGYFLEQIFNDVLPGYDKDGWREYFVRFVRGRGPLPALRFGSQPYGLIPVTSLDRFISGQAGWVNLLKSLRDVWLAEVAEVARAGRGATEIGRDLVETLGMEAISSSYSWRWARGPRFFDLFWQLPGQQVPAGQLRAAENTLELRVQSALQALGLSAQQFTRLKGMTFARVAFNWTGELVEAGPVSETQSLQNNYLSALVDKGVTLDDIHAGDKLVPTPQPLLFQLARQATLLAYAGQILRSSWPAQTNPLAAPWFEPELVDLDRTPAGDMPGNPLQTPTFWRVLKTVPAGASDSLGDTLRARGRAVAEPLRGFLTSLGGLSELPTAALARLSGEALDLASHRLDGWITSIATQRLADFRSRQSAGVYLGGYGWVEDLRPRNDAALSDGYVHAPSIAQATTAAVMRAGYLSHQDLPLGAQLEIDLSSRRVRTAMDLIDGVRQGQPLGALLGYRLERALHETSPLLNRIIAPLRALAPLAGGRLVPKDAGDPQEAIAANNVVDGLKLLELYRQAAFQLSDFNLTTDELSAVQGMFADLADALDAIGDLGVSEGVFQAVGGNYLRAGASLDSISRGEAPGEIQVVRTPQSGVAFTQRLVALFNTPPPASRVWTHPRARALAEPALNAWAEQILGDPGLVRCRAEYFNPGTDPLTDAPDGSLDVRLAALDVCALDVVYAPAVSLDAHQTEIELRLGREAMRPTRRPAGVVEQATLRLVFAEDENFQTGELTFPELFELARLIRELITNSRALEARDLARSGDGGDPGLDASALNQQVIGVMTAWQQARASLHDLFDVKVPSQLDAIKSAPFNVPEAFVGTQANLLDLVNQASLPVRLKLVDLSEALGIPDPGQLEALRDALEGLSAFALQGMVPRSLNGATDGDRKELITQVEQVYAQVMKMESRLTAITGSSITDLQAQLAVLFGEGFRILTPFTLDSQHEFPPAIARRERARDAMPGQTSLWLQTTARVRDGARRLGSVVTYSDVLGTGDDQALQVAQLPFDEQDHWNRLSGPTEDTGATSIVAYVHQTFDPTQALSGLMIDEWVERIPRRSVQTALAFHYDAPGARAPQAVLLAVSPDPAKPWDPETLLAVLNETLDLAKIRSIDYDALSHVGHILPALLFANNRGGDPYGDTVSAEFPH